MRGFSPILGGFGSIEYMACTRRDGKDWLGTGWLCVARLRCRNGVNIGIGTGLGSLGI